MAAIKLLEPAALNDTDGKVSLSLFRVYIQGNSLQPVTGHAAKF